MITELKQTQGKQLLVESTTSGFSVWEGSETKLGELETPGLDLKGGS